MRVLRLTFWFALYAAFVAWGFLFASRFGAQPDGIGEFWGWDYATYVRQYADWSWICYFGFRHPGLGLVCAPIVALDHVWGLAHLFVLSGLATGTAALVWKMSGRIGLAVWLAMPTTWYMAAIPESFPVAQFCLVASAWWLSRGERGERVGWRGWIAVASLAALNAMVTLTNGVKPLLVGLVNCGTWRQKLRVAGVAVLAALLGAAFFYVRSRVTGRGSLAGIEMTLSWIPESRHLPSELYGFFVRPVGILQSAVVYPLAAWGVARMVRARDWKVLRVLVPMFAVDFAIHWIVGWGMSEPWVFAPHWIWMLPILIGKGMRRCA